MKSETQREQDVVFRGKGFLLRALRESDLAGGWPHWFNDPEVTATQNKGFFPNTIEKQREYYLSVTQSKTEVVLAIVDPASGRHIGNVGLHAIDWVHRTAVLGIVLGDREFWGKGIGRGAWAAITRYGFETLNLHKITATVFEGNEKSLKCATAAGFKIEGTQRKQIFKNGRYLDLIHVGVFREEHK